MSGALAAHGGQHGFGHGDGAEEIGFELAAEFFELDIFGESGDRESGIVDQNVEAAVVADDGVDEAGERVEVGNVERADIELCRRHLRRLRPDRGARGAQVAHGGDDAESGLGQFDGGEQSEAAGGAGDQSDLVRHGSDSANVVTQENRSSANVVVRSMR